MNKYDRLLDLAGVEDVSAEQLEENISELAPYQVEQGLSLEDIEFRLDAAKRGVGLANKLRNPEEKKAHLSRVFTNLNRLNGALRTAIEDINTADREDRKASMR